MGLLTGSVGLFDKAKKKKDMISQTALLSMMEKAEDSKDFMKSMDEYLKNKDKQDVSIDEQLNLQKQRLNLSDSYYDDLPIEQGISQISGMRSMIGAAALGLLEQAGSAYIDNQILKSRDITRKVRFSTLKQAGNKTLGLAGAVFAGAVAGSVVPGIGNLAGGIIGGLVYAGKETINYFSNDAKEKFETSQSNKEAEINKLTLGTIYYDGNRQLK
jgi:hypothetical protein